MYIDLNRERDGVDESNIGVAMPVEMIDGHFSHGTAFLHIVGSVDIQVAWVLPAGVNISADDQVLRKIETVIVGVHSYGVCGMIPFHQCHGWIYAAAAVPAAQIEQTIGVISHGDGVILCCGRGLRDSIGW